MRPNLNLLITYIPTKQVAHNAVNAGQSTAVNAINAGKSMFRQVTAASTRYNHYPAPTPTTASEIQVSPPIYIIYTERETVAVWL